MYLWQTLATQKWWNYNQNRLRTATANGLAIIERPNRKQIELEAACRSQRRAQKLAREFGGGVKKLPKDWLKRLVGQKTKPLRVGNGELIIPVGTAFGTGEHATTAMSLRLLEKLTRKWKPGWSIVDLGTGSGILAVAANRLGARRILGIDNDLTAISTAKANARLNRIKNIQFRAGDVRRWKSRGKIDIVTANLFSELLIEILPRLKMARWLILSGILRNQARDVSRALRRNKIDILQLRRRGKWVAILAACR